MAEMTAAEISPDPPHPLEQTLSKLRAMSEWYAVFVGRDELSSAEQGDGLNVSELALTDSDYWQTQLAESMAKSSVADTRLHGYGLFSAYSWLMTTAALACYLLDKRLPELAPQRLCFRDVPCASESMRALHFAQPRFFCLPHDPHAQHPDATVVQDEAELRTQFHHQIETHFPPAMQAIQDLTGYPLRAMWAQTSDNVISFLISYVQRTEQLDQLEPLIAQFAKSEGSPLKMRNGVLCVTHESKTQLMTQRASCCFWYRWPEAKGERCMSCPGYSREKRLALMRSELS